MYDKICKVCGGSFKAVNNHYVICSEECRKKYLRDKSRIRSKIYYHTLHGKIQRKNWYKKNHTPVAKFCLSCGDPLPDGRQTYCIDCLLRDYKYGNRAVAAQRLACRGYDKEMILTEIEDRGIT